MAVNAKIIRRRIKSVGNTKKITKAVELVAAAKMRKAVRSALATRSYAMLAREMLLKLSEMKKLTKHPLMAIRPVKKILLVIVSSNRGLCGGFNSNVFKKAVEQIKNVDFIAVQRSFGKKIIPKDSKVEVEALTVGKKSEKMALKLGLKVLASFNQLSDTPHLLESRPIVEIIKTEFEKKHFDKVAIIYTDYISAISQKPTIRQVLPISPIDLEKMIKSLCEHGKDECDFEEKPVEFIFEPNPTWVLEQMLPRLTEVQIFQALLESSASEHSARMLAMRSASDAAEDMIGDLVFTLNQARQASITREIAEISGGAAALE
ncbi:MAG: ATP synthase F1 subunit gamma [Candidatus Magasanikbacteria bacterium]|nr:ATP synthase F1 subunit gamma [Candidatus Magasanikbacteria bacterium]